eukprot:TRINITY_DN93731_c0_g1_i1.p1 TRINITY_DN93731_c0_g1~~TRINITY_DN93731_c0_g1_i1.p1  ORF type:complete len:543 (-),score=73.27 TRINITY_DN93731_c0_g1_i1:358-1962(-)
MTPADCKVAIQFAMTSVPLAVFCLAASYRPVAAACRSEHGAYGSYCPVTCASYEHVESCEEGISWSTSKCCTNECKCPNGVAYSPCSEDGATSCKSCDNGYEEKNGKCVFKKCSCVGGEAASGASCPETNTATCTSCFGNFMLSGAKCVCKDGFRRQGEACERICEDAADIAGGGDSSSNFLGIDIMSGKRGSSPIWNLAGAPEGNQSKALRFEALNTEHLSMSSVFSSKMEKVVNRALSEIGATISVGVAATHGEHSANAKMTMQKSKSVEEAASMMTSATTGFVETNSEKVVGRYTVNGANVTAAFAKELTHLAAAPQSDTVWRYFFERFGTHAVVRVKLVGRLTLFQSFEDCSITQMGQRQIEECGSLNAEMKFAIKNKASFQASRSYEKCKGTSTEKEVERTLSKFRHKKNVQGGAIKTLDCGNPDTAIDRWTKTVTRQNAAGVIEDVTPVWMLFKTVEGLDATQAASLMGHGEKMFYRYLALAPNVTAFPDAASPAPACPIAKMLPSFARRCTAMRLFMALVFFTIQHF